MKQRKLTEGSILASLVTLSMPIIGTSFIQMAYNMTDMLWIGRTGSKSVAAVGTAGFFTWLAMAFILIPKTGAEVGVAQSIGKDDIEGAKSYVFHTLQLNIILGLLYAVFLVVFRQPLIGFFQLGDQEVIGKAVEYLVIIALGLPFYFVNPVLTAVYNGSGDSRTPFFINVMGLVVNMVLDPILILGLAGFPALGVRGAAMATIIAQASVTLLFIYSIRKRMQLFENLNLFQMPDKDRLLYILRLGFPVALQSGLFTIFAMVLARIVAKWGPVPIAVQKVGSQIESISWLTAGGFSSALSAFVGQNFGVKQWKRIYKGYFVGMGIMSGLGIFATLLLVFGARPIFSLFIPEPEAIAYGVVYLQVLGVSQLLMCVEIATAGAFNGLGKTVPPSIVGIAFNALRIPMALFLSSTALGVNGVWWSITISSILKGVVLTAWFFLMMKKKPLWIQETPAETVTVY